MSDQHADGEWARGAAQRLVDEFSDAVAIETAHYRLGGFILAAAALALEDASVAKRIAAKMEPPRIKDGSVLV